MNNVKILFVPDAINSEDSGARSARATLKYLLQNKFKVAIYSRDSNTNLHFETQKADYLYQVPTKLRWYEFIYSNKLSKHFERILSEFQPNYILFAGGIQKPSILAKKARNKGIKTLFLFYINDFYCQKIYSGISSGPCNKCNSGNQIPALTQGCISYLKFPNWIKSSIVRYLLGKEIRKSAKVIGYGNEQLNTYRQFGIKEDKLAIIGFQFDPSELDNILPIDGDYYIISGQTIVQKGWHLLNEIIDNLDENIKIKITFKNIEEAKLNLSKYKLDKYFESKKIDIVLNLDKRNDYLEFLAYSKGIILPTYYPTTGEFILQEAMYFKKVVYVFDVGVHKDILINDFNAMVSKVGDIKNYSNNINKIDKDRLRRLIIGENSKNTVSKQYSGDSIKLIRNLFV
jgi:glycosyltransferase involved in cell wall biosynthesis